MRWQRVERSIWVVLDITKAEVVEVAGMAEAEDIRSRAAAAAQVMSPS